MESIYENFLLGRYKVGYGADGEEAPATPTDFRYLTGSRNGWFPHDHGYANTFIDRDTFSRKKHMWESKGLRQVVRHKLGLHKLPRIDERSCDEALEQVESVIMALYEINAELEDWTKEDDGNRGVNYWKGCVKRATLPALQATAKSLMFERVRLRHFLTQWNRLQHWIDVLVDQICNYYVILFQYGLPCAVAKSERVLGEHGGVPLTYFWFLRLYGLGDLAQAMGIGDTFDKSGKFRTAVGRYFDALRGWQAQWLKALASIQSAYAKKWEEKEKAEQAEIDTINKKIARITEVAGYVDTASAIFPSLSLGGLVKKGVGSMGQGLQRVFDSPGNVGLGNLMVRATIYDQRNMDKWPSDREARWFANADAGAQALQTVISAIPEPPPTLQLFNGELHMVDKAIRRKVSIDHHGNVSLDDEVELAPNVLREDFKSYTQGRMTKVAKEVLQVGWKKHLETLAADTTPQGRMKLRETQALASLVNGVATGSLNFATLANSVATLYYNDDLLRHACRKQVASEFKQLVAGLSQGLLDASQREALYAAEGALATAREAVSDTFQGYRDALLKDFREAGPTVARKVRKAYAEFADAEALREEINKQNALQGLDPISRKQARREFKKLQKGWDFAPSCGVLAQRIRQEPKKVLPSALPGFFDKLPYAKNQSQLLDVAYYLPGNWDVEVDDKPDQPMSGNEEQQKEYYLGFGLVLSQIKAIDVSAQIVAALSGTFTELVEPDPVHDVWSKPVLSDPRSFLDLGATQRDVRGFGEKIDVWSFLRAYKGSRNAGFQGIGNLDEVLAVAKDRCSSAWNTLEKAAGQGSNELLLNKVIAPLERSVSKPKSSPYLKTPLSDALRRALTKVFAETRAASGAPAKDQTFFKNSVGKLIQGAPYVGGPPRRSLQQLIRDGA